MATAVDTTRRKYVVGFTVHEARELSSDGSAIDPLVVVRAMGREYKTQLKKDKLQHVKFEESSIWSDLELSDNEFNMAFIEFELQSAMIFSRNEVVGLAKVQLAMVRKRPNHSYNNKTLQLTAATSATAKLKVSVFCYGEGDDPPKPQNDGDHHDEAAAAQLENLSAAVLGTGGDNHQFTQAYHLFVHVHRAQHLGGGKGVFNPYITCEFNGHNLSLASATHTNSINNDELFKIPVITPLFADSIVLRVWNKGDWGSRTDEVIVQGRLSFSLLRMHAMAPKWFNFYGFDKEEVPDCTKLTGGGESAEPNTYMGRLLISARVTKVASVEELHRPMVIKGQLMEEPPAAPMTFIVDVFEIAGVVGSQAYIKLSLGNKYKKTKLATSDAGILSSGSGRFVFKGRDGRIEAFEANVDAEPENQLDVIISLYMDQGGVLRRGFERIGFKRLKIGELREWTGSPGAPQWLSMRRMAHLPSSVEPGSVLISIFKSDHQIKERGRAKNMAIPFEVRAYVIKARHLHSPQAARLPNPFAELSSAGEKVATRTIRSTTSPTWGECLKLPVKLYAASGSTKVQPEPVKLSIWDEEESRFLDQEQEEFVSVDATKPSGKRKEHGGVLGLTDIGLGLANAGLSALADGVQERIDDLRGDVVAHKRRHDLVNNRRLIGTVQVTLSSVVKPGESQNPYLKWLKVKGGLTGNADVGDILVGFELMEERHAKSIPVKTTTPPLKECTLSVCVLGLRHLTIPPSDLGKPKLMVLSPNLDGFPHASVIEWQRKPDFPVNTEDDNRRWTKAGKSGYEFLSVVHLPAKLPKSAVHEPEVVFRLFPEGGDVRGEALAEGRYSVAMDLPWATPEDAKQRIAADGDYEGDDAREHVEGVDVAAKPEVETEAHVEPYVDIVFETLPVEITFNVAEGKSYPPTIASIGASAPCAGRIKAGDWLVGYRGPRDVSMENTGTWINSEAERRLNGSTVPLGLRFRRRDKREVTLRFSRESRTGLNFVPDPNVRPPRISDDTSPDGRWRAAGVKPGWFVVDVNGVDCSELAGNDPALHQLLGARPVAITCSALAGRDRGGGGANAEDRALQRSKPVGLDGLPSALQLAMEEKVKVSDGPLMGTRVPRPSVLLPPVTEARFLNMRIARSALLDVRGFVRFHAHGNEEEDDNDKARPAVNGKMEEFLDDGVFRSAELTKGQYVVGQVKFAFKIVLPPDPKWVEKIADRYDPLVSLFDTKHLRLKYKKDQPATIRLRAYIVRGLNISGVNRPGFANPYLYFRFGNSSQALEGHKQMNAVEPRFFRTEESDLAFPEEALFEVGLYDWSNGSSDPLIGRTTIDLEDRWYSPKFQEYLKQSKVPIEYRPLVSDAQHISKGSLEMWVEVLDSQLAPDVPVSTLYQPPPVEVEIRIVVWGVRDLSRKLALDEYGDEKAGLDILARCQIDCKQFAGTQKAQQETDIHHGAGSFAEFNWRFVYSRVLVTRGVSLDCFIQLSLWESYALQRPQLLCESLIDMKTYCKRVATQRTTVQIESEIALTSKHFEKLNAQEGDLLGGPRGGGADSDTDDDEDEDDDRLRPRAQAFYKEKDPPAALMKVLVQVLPQTEANMGDNRAGLGRGEPNQNPALTYPTTGRNWQATLPTVQLAVDNIIHAYGRGRMAFKCLVIISLLALPICILHWIERSNGCPLIMSSCADATTCPACSKCRSQAEQKSKYCFYSLLWSADGYCAEYDVQKNLCNINIAKKDCFVPSDPTFSEQTLLRVMCQNPSLPLTSVVTAGTGSRR